MKNNIKGVTLIEMMVTVTVILLALVPLLRLFITANKGNQHLAQVTVAENLIQQTFDEIGRKKWDENCPTPGDFTAGPVAPGDLGTDTGEDPNDKKTYDDMDDYAEIGEPSPDTPRDLSGEIIPGYEAFGLDIDVIYVLNPSPGPPTESPGAATNFKKITVSVTWKGGGTADGDTVKTKTRIFYNGVDYRM